MRFKGLARWTTGSATFDKLHERNQYIAANGLHRGVDAIVSVGNGLNHTATFSGVAAVG
ncbi:MAG: hypothetical protein ACREPE_14095 [Lysobacter sp.]